MSDSENLNYSALWSSLRTLELTNQFTTTSVEPAKSYDTFYGDYKDQKHHMRHKKLASGLALINATSPDAKTVTACSVEVTYTEDSDDPVFILRIAHNKLVNEKERSELQSLVDELVSKISAHDKSVWNDKQERYDTIHSIVIDVLLPRIVERCKEKISQIFIGHSRPFRDWYAKIDKSNPLEDAVTRSDPRLDLLDNGLETINNCSGDDSILKDASYVRSMFNFILNAYAIMANFDDILERQWAVYNSETPVIDDEDDDDRNFLDPVEMKKSPIYRFFRKLERYYDACRIVTSEVAYLVRKNFAFKITVATVSILTTTSTPVDQNEYPTCDEFFTKCLKIDMKMLDPKKVDSLRGSWIKSRISDNLFLHAEMQMALFYALNPQLRPIEGFIGVSKKCCWCCAFVKTPTNF